MSASNTLTVSDLASDAAPDRAAGAGAVLRLAEASAVSAGDEPARAGTSRGLQVWRGWRGWVLPAALVAVWYGVTRLGWVNTKLIVPPADVVSAGAKALADQEFYVGVGYSLGRDLIGFSLGSLAGVALGLLLGVSRWADRLIGPTFHTLRQISLFAWLPLLSSFLGVGDPAKVVFIAFSAFYPVVLAMLEGVRGVSLAHAEVARVYGFSRTQLLLRLILPSASPQIIGGLRLGLIYAWLATIGSEYLLASVGSGLGSTVFRGRASFNVGLIIFGMLAIGLIGTLLNKLAAWAEERALRWRAPQA
jgi:sulfonate transport system permease protein